MNTWIERLTASAALTLDDAASDAVYVQRAAVEIGPRACEWAIESARRIVSEVEHEFASEGSVGVMTGQEGEAFESSLLTTLVALHGDIPASDIIRPRGAEENVRLAARQGIPIGTLLRIVWSCHTKTQDALLRELESLVDRGALTHQMRKLNLALYSYVDLYVKGLTNEYQNELVAWSGHIPAERLQIMTSLLAGEPATLAYERALGLRITDHHLVGVAWLPSDRHIPDRQAELSRFGSRVGRALGATAALTLHHDGVADFWWTFESTPAVDLAEAIGSSRQPQWARLAIGDVRNGLEGFRLSYAAAHQAAKVGRLAASGELWSYRDVRLIALLCSDEDAARRFVRDELSGLDGAEQKVMELRSTLRAFLRSGNSRLLAARELNLAANTVAYRVARASALLGRSATERPVETLLALELVHYFPQFVSPADNDEL